MLVQPGASPAAPTRQYICFSDCGTFPPNWYQVCLGECDNGICAPPRVSERSAAVEVRAASLLVVAAALLAVYLA